MKIHARFAVQQHIRFPKWGSKPQEMVDQFKLSGVQGEPFGSATPSATMDMVIYNHEAAKVFIDALENNRQVDVFFSPVEPAQE